jgi:intracellular septation protein
MNQLTRFAFDAGPLVVFFIAYSIGGFMVATGVFMVAFAISVGVTFAVERRVPTVALVTGVVVLVFGGLTLYLNDETFFKLKPTIVNGLFAALLFGGLMSGRAFVKVVLGPVWTMDDEGWRRLTFRWACFFATMAVVNEIVWRNFSTDAWVSFKVFGFLPLTVLFSLTQLPLMQRHHVEKDAA